MPRLTIQEAAELGLLSPEELARIGGGPNPFTPRAGASWTPQLGLRPGLSSRSFFRYPSLYQRPGISSLRFGLGGLGQGLTLSPESPALGLGGISAPVGAAARRTPSYGVAGGVAGGIAGGRAGIGSEGSGNLPTMILPDGRRLVRLPDGRAVIVGGPGAPLNAESHDGQEALAAMGVISRGVGVSQQLARIFGGGGETHDIPGPTRDQHISPDDTAEALEAFAVGGAAEPVAGPAAPDTSWATLSPADRIALEEFASPGSASIGPTGYTDLGPGSDFWRSLELTPPTPSPGVIGGSMLNLQGQTPEGPLVAPPGAEMMPGAVGGGDLALSPAFYAQGGGNAASMLLDPETRRLYELGLMTPEDIMAMMPAPNVDRADLAPRGLGPGPTDVFGPEPQAEPGSEPGTSFTFGNTLGLGQTLLNVGQAGITGDPGQIVGALIRSGLSVNQIARLPGLNKAGIDAGLGGALGILNLVQAARSGNIPGAIGGGLATLGSGARFLAGSPSLAGMTGMTPGALNTVGTVAGGAGGLLSLATGIKSLIDGGADPVQSALSLAGGLTSTYSALVSLSQMYPNMFSTTLPSISQLLDSAATGLGFGGTAAGAGTGLAGATAAGASGAAVADAAMGGTVAGVAGGTSGGTGVISGALAAAAPWLAVAAPVIIGIVGTLSQNEQRRIMRAGYVNNPIAGNLYSNVSAGLASAKADMDKLGPLEKANTADLAMALTTGANNLKGYYTSIQGPGGPVRASSTITGMYGRPGAGGQGGIPTAEEWQKNAMDMRDGLANIAKELMARGVTYEQIGQLPISQDWALQDLDAYDPLDDFYARGAAKYDAEGQQLIGSLGSQPALYGVPIEGRGVTPRDLFVGAQGAAKLAPDAVTKAGGLVTSMYGGPFWAMLARTGGGGPEMQQLIQDHFDPWVIARTAPPEKVAQMVVPVVQREIFEQTGVGTNATPGAIPTAYYPTIGLYQGPGKIADIFEQDLGAAIGAGTISDMPVLDPASGRMVYTSIGGPKPPTKAEWDAGAAQRQQQAALKQQQKYAWMTTPPVGAVPAGNMAFDPLKFLSSLESGERAQIQSGQDTLTFVPYKPDQGQMFSVPDAGYQQIGEGFYAKPSGQGNGAEIYLPQDKASELGKALAGYQGGSPVAGQLSALLTQPIASGQEAGATPGAGPASDIAPSPVAAGTDSAEQPSGSTVTPPDATQPVPGTGFQKGGVVPETGRYVVHKGEVVIPADKADTEQESESFLEGMRKRGDLKLGGEEDRKLEMPKLGPGPLERGEDPTMPDEAQAPKEKGWYVHLKEGLPSQDLDGTDPEVRRLAFTPEEVEESLEAGEAPIMVGKGVLGLPPSAFRRFLQNAQNMQNKDPLKHPAVVAMMARAKREAQLKPEGDTLPGGSPDDIRNRVQRKPAPKFPGHRPEQAIPLDSVSRPPDFGKKDDEFSIMDALPKSAPQMPTIPVAPPDRGMQVRGLGGPGIGRAMRLAQGPAEDFARQNRMLEGIDTGRIAPSTLGGASREQRRNLTPPDIQNRPTRPTPPPGLLEQARRKTFG